MKNYLVKFTGYIPVEAENEEEAISIVQEMGYSEFMDGIEDFDNWKAEEFK